LHRGSVPPGITNSTWPSGSIQIPSGTATDQTPGPPHGCPHWGPPRSPPPSSASGLQSAGRLRGQADGQRVGTDCGKTGGMEPLPMQVFPIFPSRSQSRPEFQVSTFSAVASIVHLSRPCLALQHTPAPIPGLGQEPTPCASPLAGGFALGRGGRTPRCGSRSLRRCGIWFTALADPLKRGMTGSSGGDLDCHGAAAASAGENLPMLGAALGQPCQVSQAPGGQTDHAPGTRAQETKYP